MLLVSLVFQTLEKMFPYIRLFLSLPILTFNPHDFDSKGFDNKEHLVAAFLFSCKHGAI